MLAVGGKGLRLAADGHLHPSATIRLRPTSAVRGVIHPSLHYEGVAPHPVASKRAYLELREAYSRFVAAFRDAAEKLKAGDRTVAFPEGSFPPASPFVRSGLRLAAVG